MCRTLDSPQLVQLHQEQQQYILIVDDMASAPRNTLAKPMKPKLSRKITKSPRINLNNYWNLFKKIMDEPDDDLTDATNTINDNLENERRLALMGICGDNEDKKRSSDKMETGLRSGSSVF